MRKWWKFLFTSILIIQNEYALCMMVNLNLSIPMVWPCFLFLFLFTLMSLIQNFNEFPQNIFTPHTKLQQEMKSPFIISSVFIKNFVWFLFPLIFIAIITYFFKTEFIINLLQCSLCFFINIFSCFTIFYIINFLFIHKLMFTQASNKLKKTLRLPPDYQELNPKSRRALCLRKFFIS